MDNSREKREHYRVFVVEDHPVMREAYAAVLEREPDLELCGTAERAEEALDAIHSHACDLVIVDVSLPGMSGLDLVRRLRDENQTLCVLVISGHGSDVFAHRALDAGADRYLSKSALVGTLPGAIREVLARSRGVEE